MYDRVIRTGDRVEGREWIFEIATDDGSAREISLDFRIVPWRADDRTIPGCIGTATDITELVAARRAAERGEAPIERRR